MRRWGMGLALALLVMPLGAEAGMKSILRFEKNEKPAAAEPEVPITQAPAVEDSDSPASQGAVPGGDVGGRADWYGEKFPTEGAAAGTPRSGAGLRQQDDSALPGTPAEEEDRVPAPRATGRVRSTPVPPPPDLPIAAPAPRPASAANPVVIQPAPAPSLPQRPEPFTYMPSPPRAITPRGYDPSFAPMGGVRLPAPPVAGQLPARPRALPRLAPYGTALPPDHPAPPAAAPR